VQFLERWEQALSADGRHSAAVADDHIEIYNAPFTSAAATISMPPSTGVSIRSSDWHNLKLSADGELVAWAGAGSVAVVNARNGKPLATVQALEPMHSFAIARDALVIAAKGQIEIHDPANGNKLKSAPMEDVRDAVLSPDGRYAAIVDSAGQLFLWPVSGDSPPVKTGGLTGGSAVRNTDVVGHPRFSPEGNWLAACSSGHEMNIVRTDAPSEIRATDVDVACRSVSFDSAGGLLAVAGDGGVSVWSVGDWRKKGGVPIRGGVAGAVLSLDGALLATHGSGSSLVSPASPATKGSPSVLRVWRWRTGEELARVQVDDATGDDLAFAAGDQLFDRTFLLWKPADVMAEACRYLTRNLTPSEVADYLPWEMGPRPWQKGYRPVCSVRPEVIEKIEKPPQP